MPDSSFLSLVALGGAALFGLHGAVGLAIKHHFFRNNYCGQKVGRFFPGQGCLACLSWASGEGYDDIVEENPNMKIDPAKMPRFQRIVLGTSDCCSCWKSFRHIFSFGKAAHKNFGFFTPALADKKRVAERAAITIIAFCLGSQRAVCVKKLGRDFEEMMCLLSL